MHIEDSVLQLLSEWNLEKASGTSLPMTTDNVSNMETAFAHPKWKHMPERHTGVHIEERVLQLLSEWNLEKASDTSLPMTTDNVSNMETAFACPKWKHIHCVAPTLNLCVDEGLQKPAVQ